MPPDIPRPPRRPSHVDQDELDEERPSRPLAVFGEEPGSRSGREPYPGRYALRPDTEERLVRALKTLETIPPLQAATGEKVDSISVDLMKINHQAQLEGQRRDLAFERLGERVATIEHRVKQLEDLDGKAKETELDRARSTQAHWVRYVVSVVVAVLTGALLLGVGRLLR